jgi:hypothetical protein
VAERGARELPDIKSAMQLAKRLRPYAARFGDARMRKRR